MRRILGLVGCSACTLAFVACSATTTPTDSSAPGRASGTSSGAAPRLVPATPFSRVQTAPVVDDDRYAKCHWSAATYRRCSGVADIRETVQVCSDCLVDGDCAGGSRCVDAVLPGSENVPVRACAYPDTPCFIDGGCPREDACTALGTSVVCSPRDICSAP